MAYGNTITVYVLTPYAGITHIRLKGLTSVISAFYSTPVKIFKCIL